MPNHIHGIPVISDIRRGGSRTAPTRRKPLGGLIGAFKTVSTKRINATRGTPGKPAWQRGYYEHVIRDEAELHRIRAYTVNNPLRCALDRENLAVARPSRSGRRTDAIQTIFETGAA